MVLDHVLDLEDVVVAEVDATCMGTTAEVPVVHMVIPVVILEEMVVAKVAVDIHLNNNRLSNLMFAEDRIPVTGEEDPEVDEYTLVF